MLRELYRPFFQLDGRLCQFAESVRQSNGNVMSLEDGIFLFSPGGILSDQTIIMLDNSVIVFDENAIL